MAESAQSAFMLWRQFSGDAKAPAHQNLRGVSAASVQPDIHIGPQLSDQIRSFAGAATDFFQAKQGLDKVQKAQSEAKVDAWMNQHTMAEYRQKMRENNVPFQDDRVAMDILHNNAAYGVALEVEEAIQNKIKAGSFKTTDEAEKARSEALNGARSEYALSMGISPDNKAFIAGFDRDADKRRNLLVGLQQDVTDKLLRTQAKTAAQAAILAPLTESFVRNASPETTAAYIVNTVKQQQVLGQIRSDQDAAEVLAKAVNSLKGTSGGAAALKALGSQEYSMFGTTAKLRDHLGGGVFDAAVIGALDREQQLDATRQGGLNVKLIGLLRSNDLGGAMALRAQLSEESGGKMTKDLSEVDHSIKQIQLKIDRDNAAAIVQHQKNAEEQSRITAAMATMRGYLSGDLQTVSLENADLGLKNSLEASKAEQLLLGQIENEDERLQVALKLAAKRPEGFSANALKDKDRAAGIAWDQYLYALRRGDTTAQLPEKVQAMQNLYTADPEAYSMAFKESPYIAALEVSRVTGSSVADVARNEVEWKKLPADTKKAAEKELTIQLNRVGGYNAPYVNDAIRTLSSAYLAQGISPDRAVQLGRQQFDKQTVKVLEAPIHKGFFSISGEPSSFEQGRAAFDVVLPEVRKELGSSSNSMTALRYDLNNQKVVVTNLQTGDSREITQDMIRQRALKEAEAAKAKVKAQIDQAVAQEARSARMRSQNNAGESDIIQTANPAWSN